jgi:hypothetical protein
MAAGRFRMTRPDAAAGPLQVCAVNPRYFTADGIAVYLTGSHTWNNFHDGMGCRRRVRAGSRTDGFQDER